MGDWWAQMVRERASDLQMPIYMFYVWAYEKVFGSGEWVLRMANLPWFVTGVAVFAWGQRAVNPRACFTTAVALLSPFAWYYLDEARPYGMQLGASFVVVGALCRLNRTPPTDGEGHKFPKGALIWFFAGLIALSGSSMLGMIWAGAAVLALLWVAPGRWQTMLLTEWPATVLTALVLAGLGIYYLWALSIGARASYVAANFQSVLFIGYELLGFMGLGPGRLELRSGGVSALGPYLPWIAVYAVTVASVFLRGLLEWLRGSCGEVSVGRKLLLAGIVVLPAAFLVATGFVATFRVLGRHFTPVFPVAALILGTGAGALWTKRGYLGKAFAGFLLVMALGSCLELRFSERHAKDDYRQAAGIAKEAINKGLVVWWSAAEEGARYYGLKVDAAEAKPGAAWLCLNPDSAILQKSAEPDLIITSKPDVYDNIGAMGRYTEERGYVPLRRLAAFVLWKKAEKNG